MSKKPGSLRQQPQGRKSVLPRPCDTRRMSGTDRPQPQLLMSKDKCPPNDCTPQDQTFLRQWFAQQSLHGKPLQIGAHPKMQRRDGTKTYGIVCRSCEGKTCTWKPRARYCPKSRTWAVWGYETHKHGTARKTKVSFGRPLSEAQLLEDICTSTHDGTPYNRRQLRSEVKGMMLAKHAVRVSCHSRKTAPPGSVVYRLGCASHKTEGGETCPWSGSCVYIRKLRKLILRGQPIKAHGSH